MTVQSHTVVPHAGRRVVAPTHRQIRQFKIDAGKSSVLQLWSPDGNESAWAQNLHSARTKLGMQATTRNALDA